MPEFVSDDIACDPGQCEGLLPQRGNCDQHFSERRQGEREWIETGLLGQNYDHVTVRFPDAIQQRGRNDARRRFERAEVAGRDYSEAVRYCAQAERAAKLRELGIPEIDRNANGGYSGIILGR
jgi:hypothetical protein